MPKITKPETPILDQAIYDRISAQEDKLQIITPRAGSADAPNLDDLTFAVHLAGGDGGVDIFKDTKGKKWCVKSWTDKGHGINEVIAGEMLNMMGIKTPISFCYESLPEHLNRREGKANLFRISEFVEGRKPDLTETQAYFKPHYADLAFLGAWDTKNDNLIVDEKGDFYYIDTGSALLYRATKGMKEESRHASPWSAFQVTELSSFQTHGISSGMQTVKTDATQYVVRPDQDVLDHSIEDLLKMQEELLVLADNLAVTFAYPKRAQLMGMATAKMLTAPAATMKAAK